MPKLALAVALLVALLGCADEIEVGTGRPLDAGADSAVDTSVDELQARLIEASERMQGEWKPPPGLLLPFTGSPPPTLIFKPTLGTAGGIFQATCSNRSSCPLPSAMEDAGSPVPPNGKEEYKGGIYLLFRDDDGKYLGLFSVEGWTMGMTFKPATDSRAGDVLSLNPFPGTDVTFSRR